MDETVCKVDMCAGCMACVEKCPKGAISVVDSVSSYNAYIDHKLCINCGLCQKTCQENSFIQPHSPCKWYEGWASNESIRRLGSSGGVATAIMCSFVNSGGYVCSCTMQEGRFVFDITNKESEIFKFSGSKYVKSNPFGVYRKVQTLLRNGKAVLFLGLPCQVAAIKLFAGQDLLRNLYTIDLICHGTPSPKFLEKYLKEHNYLIESMDGMRFRNKTIKRLYNRDFEALTDPQTIDPYILSFLSGLNYTENCYACKYARLERVSDITLGDSWGSIQKQEEAKGISLILCQTERGQVLLKNSDVRLHNVDIKNAIKNNKQLSAPTHRNPKRESFFAQICKGKKYDKVIHSCFRWIYIKQYIKKLLIILRIIQI